MNRSLTVVLPVRSAAQRLAEDIRQLCEIVGDLTSRFEVLLVDEGTPDAAVEEAYELAAEYPQVRVVRSGARPGIPSALDAALEHATGDVVLVQHRPGAVRPSDLRRLWEGPHELAPPALSGAGRSAGPRSVMQRLEVWGRTLRRQGPLAGAATAGFQVVRRRSPPLGDHADPSHPPGVASTCRGPEVE